MSRIVPRDWLEWAWAVCIALNVGVGAGAVTVGEWWRAVDAVTISILFALLVRFRRLAKYWEAEATIPPGPHIAGTLPDGRTIHGNLTAGWSISAGTKDLDNRFIQSIGTSLKKYDAQWRIRKKEGSWNVYRRRPVGAVRDSSGLLTGTEIGRWRLDTRYPTFTAALRHTERKRP